MAGVGVEMVVEVDQLFSEMEKKLKSFESQSSEKKERSTIYRVVPSVREDDGAAYDPKIISIGPYHREKNQLLPMEDVKWQFLLSLINRHKDNQLAKWIRVVRAYEPRARKLYSEKLELEPDAFVEMLVLDCCLILELITKIVLKKENEEIFDENWKLPLIRSDLLLLENQIPFFILQALFDSTVIPGISLTLPDLALMYVTNARMDTAPNVEIHHLLHLFHLSLMPNTGQKEPKPFSYLSLSLYLPRKFKRFISYVFIGLLSLILCCFRRSRPLPVKEKSQRAPRTIPSVTELQEAGIMFKKREDAMCYLDVKFENSTMEIPQLSIQATTISEFRNLIAFEQCCPGSGSHFTSYATFMDHLINTQIDVAVLQDCGIIESKLGSYKDVAIFFNQLCKGGYLDYEKHYLVQVFKDVRKFCSSDLHRWRAMLVHDYFSNPWAIISFIAAFLLLGLTIVQTVFSILSYVHPPH
ncbi:hypothetical protein DsansV1_C01g0011611 [Dioscorea sansibarensis]